jgi:hypothetical protein
MTTLKKWLRPLQSRESLFSPQIVLAERTYIEFRNTLRWDFKALNTYEGGAPGETGGGPQGDCGPYRRSVGGASVFGGSVLQCGLAHSQ